MMQQRSLVTQFQWLAVRNSSLLARIDLNATRVRAMPSADYQLVYFVNQYDFINDHIRAFVHHHIHHQLSFE